MIGKCTWPGDGDGNTISYDVLACHLDLDSKTNLSLISPRQHFASVSEIIPPASLGAFSTSLHPISPQPSTPPDNAGLSKIPGPILFLPRCSRTDIENGMRTRMLLGAVSVVPI